MSFRSGEGAGEENALSRHLRGLDRGEGEPLDVDLLIVGGGSAGTAAFEAARGVRAIAVDTRSGRAVSVRGGRLAVAEDGFVRPVHARAVVLATGASPKGAPQLAIAKALGCRTAYDRALRHERLVLHAGGETSVPGIFAAGAVASASDAVASGRHAGEAAAAQIGRSS